MNRNILRLSATVLALFLGGIFSGCTTETAPGTAAPSSLEFNATGSQSIRVRWVRASGDVTADTVKAMKHGSTTVDSWVASTATSSEATLGTGAMPLSSGQI